jgi:hypothetical protein
MRYDRNFNQEWGCLGPAPSAMHTPRLIGIAVIIGATVGGATVFSLLDRPLAEGSVAAPHIGCARLRAAAESRHIGRGPTAGWSAAG